jgi:hypothetical protein
MIFYEVLGTSAAPRCLVGTQVDAKRLAKERGTSWEQVNVPIDKDGLMAYINELKAGINAEMHREPTRDEIINSNTPEMQAKARELMAPKPLDETGPITAQIEEFILDRASVAQVERIFSALGTRFAEGMK